MCFIIFETYLRTPYCYFAICLVTDGVTTQMPFLSPDWRCPGEKYIKSSEDGNTWENAKDWREKVFANMNDVALKRFIFHFSLILLPPYAESTVSH